MDNDGGGNESAPAPESARRLLRAPPQPLQLGEVRRHAGLVPVSRLVAGGGSSSSRFYYDTILRQFNRANRRVMQYEIRWWRVRLRFSRLGFASFAAALVLASPARADLVITVDKSAQQMTVADDGTVLYTWPVSTGMADYDTPTGEFKPFRMERDHSREWDDAPMPYSIFFTQEGHAIHGSNDVKHLGRPASHGCVRLSHPHAATLFSQSSKRV